MIFAESLLYQLPIVKFIYLFIYLFLIYLFISYLFIYFLFIYLFIYLFFIYLFIYLFIYFFFFLITHEDSLLVSTQEQNTAVDGWNEQISQLTAECDQLKDSLQEINKVLASTFSFLL